MKRGSLNPVVVGLSIAILCCGIFVSEASAFFQEVSNEEIDSVFVQIDDLGSWGKRGTNAFVFAVTGYTRNPKTLCSTFAAAPVSMTCATPERTTSSAKMKEFLSRLDILVKQQDLHTLLDYVVYMVTVTYETHGELRQQSMLIQSKQANYLFDMLHVTLGADPSTFRPYLVKYLGAVTDR
jgi:hypothetical protein